MMYDLNTRYQTQLLVVVILLMCGNAFGQNDSMLQNEWKNILQIDTVTVYAKGARFNIPSFMRLVFEDKSLHQSFKNLHSVPYSAHHSIVVRNEQNTVAEYFSAKTFQEIHAACREIKYSGRNFSAGFFKKSKKHKYYTTEIYERMFLPQGQICHHDNNETESSKNVYLSAYTEKIKQMVFRPTQKTFLPFIGDQNEIFSPKHRQKYIFKLRRINIAGKEAYEFDIRRKPNVPDSDILIDKMVTWFDASDLQVIRRTMTVRKKGGFFDMDVNIDVGTTKTSGLYVPAYMKYTGNWHIPFSKKERISFKTTFQY